jgi:hypothetical protein
MSRSLRDKDEKYDIARFTRKLQDTQQSMAMCNHTTVGDTMWTAGPCFVYFGVLVCHIKILSIPGMKRLGRDVEVMNEWSYIPISQMPSRHSSKCTYITHFELCACC